MCHPACVPVVRRCGRRLPTQRRSFLVGNLLCRQKNIIDISTGRVVKTLDDFVCTRRYVTCYITPDQRHILIGEDFVTKLFDFQQGTLLATFPAENLPCVFTSSDDSRYVFVGYVDDCIFKVSFNIRFSLCFQSRTGQYFSGGVGRVCAPLPKVSDPRTNIHKQVQGGRFKPPC